MSEPCECMITTEIKDSILIFVAKWIEEDDDDGFSMFRPKCGTNRYTFIINNEELERMELQGLPGHIYTFRLRIGEGHNKSHLTTKEAALFSALIHDRFSLSSSETHLEVDDVLSCSVVAEG